MELGKSISGADDILMKALDGVGETVRLLSASTVISSLWINSVKRFRYLNTLFEEINMAVPKVFEFLLRSYGTIVDQSNSRHIDCQSAGTNSIRS